MHLTKAQREISICLQNNVQATNANFNSEDIPKVKEGYLGIGI